MRTKYQGKIRWYSPDLGYGFIVVGIKEIFLSGKGFADYVHTYFADEGDLVELEIGYDRESRQAWAMNTRLLKLI